MSDHDDMAASQEVPTQNQTVERSEDEKNAALMEWESLFNAITDPVMILDREHLILKNNLAAARIIRNYQPGVTRCCEMFRCRELGIKDCPATKTFETGTVARRETGWYQVGPHWLDASTYPISDSDGKISHVVLIARDVTEKKTIYDELKKSEEKYRNLFETMAQGVVYQDSEGRIISANSSAEKILGLTMDQMLGRASMDPRWKTIREDKSPFPGSEHPAMEALKTGQMVKDVIMGVYHPEQDQYRWIKVNAVPQFRPEQTRPFQVYTTFEDITDMKQAEEELALAKFSLEIFSKDLRDTLNLSESQRMDMETAKSQAEELAAAAEAANRAKSEFLANISHELRTPLNPILGMTDLLLELDPTPEQRLYLTDVHKSALKLSLVVNDLIDLSKIEAGALAMTWQPFALGSVLAAVTKEFAGAFEAKNLTFRQEIDTAVPELITGDSASLRKILTKLLDNAVKFTDAGRVVLTVTLDREDDDRIWLHLVVTDTGIGISEANLELLFRDFTQVDGSMTRQYGGLGLGLTLSRRLVKRMGGDIWADSQEGLGSSFHVLLPFQPMV